MTDCDHKIVVLGSGGVGKSATTIQFIRNYFEEETDPTIEEQYRKQCVIDGRVEQLDILDTAGQEEYSAMREQYMRSGDGYIIVFSLTDRDSFDEINNFHKLILRVKNKDHFPIVLVGNKADLVHERVISAQEFIVRARHLGVPFLESTAKQREQVDKLFYEIVREMRSFKKQSDTARKKKIRRKCTVL